MVKKPGREAETCFHLLQRYECMELYLYSPICLQSGVLNSAEGQLDPLTCIKQWGIRMFKVF
jgi:hypothetical protein